MELNFACNGMGYVVVWLRLNILVFTTSVQHKANLIVLQVLLLPCRFLISF